MQRLKKLILPLLLIVFLNTLNVSGFAEERKYTIRVYGGDRGTLASGVISNSSIPYNGSYGFPLGSEVSLKTTDAEGNPVDYRVIGVKEAGKDNYDNYYGMNPGSGQVNITNIRRDTDYVVAYSVPGAVTTFEVQYLDYSTGADIKGLVDREEGETLDDITYFYGVIGAQITVAYRYIEGYTPMFDGVSKTLSADATENVFPLYYTKNTTSSSTTTTTTVTTGGGGGGAAVAGGAAANANNAANNQNANNPNANNQQPNGTNTPAPNIPGNVVINDNGEEILDLDVPLAAPNIPGVGTVSVPNAPQVIEPNQHGRVPNWMLIAGAVLLVGLISVLYWYLLFYRKKKKYASLNEDYDILDFDKDDDF